MSLSDKIWHVKDYSLKEGCTIEDRADGYTQTNIIPVGDIKEFIRELKKKLTIRKDWNISFIDELAGEDLI